MYAVWFSVVFEMMCFYCVGNVSIRMRTYVVNESNFAVFNKQTTMMSAAFGRWNWDFKLWWPAHTVFTRLQWNRAMKLLLGHIGHSNETPIGFRRHYTFNQTRNLWFCTQNVRQYCSTLSLAAQIQFIQWISNVKKWMYVYSRYS